MACAMIARVKTTDCLVIGVSLATGVGVPAESAPEAEITNGQIRVRLYLPDAHQGFYRGTRFDWSGVIGSLQFAGHEFYPPWFQRTDPNVHDFTYDGADIVAGPCTAITGPAEEFVADGKALGFDEARAGLTFIKIGVGVLRRPDDRAYDPYRLYPIADGGRRTHGLRKSGETNLCSPRRWPARIAFTPSSRDSVPKPRTMISGSRAGTWVRAFASRRTVRFPASPCGQCARRTRSSHSLICGSNRAPSSPGGSTTTSSRFPKASNEPHLFRTKPQMDTDSQGAATNLARYQQVATKN